MNTGVDVSCESPGFTQRELRCWGARLCSSGVGNRCTITKGPDAWRIRDGKRGIDNDGAAFVMLDSKGLEKRTRGCTGCPYECLRANLFVGLQDHHILPCISQACIELEGDSSFPYEPAHKRRGVHSTPGGYARVSGQE